MAGGIPALANEIRELLSLNVVTVTGKSLGDNVASATITDTDVIRPLSNPYSPTGGLTILFGNLAPESAVVKSGAVAPEMMVHSGPARVFDSEEEAAKAITSKEIKPGEVVIIRYEGLHGAAQGTWAGQGSGPCHRWPFLRSHQRSFHRARVTRGRRPGTDSGT